MKQNILNKKDKLDWEQLIQAINSQDLERLKDVIKKISETNQKKVKILLNHSENSSLTPFEQAVKSGSIKIIKYLIDNRWEFNIQAKSKSGKTPLEIAIDRLSQSDTEENQQIVNYLRGNIMTQENDLEYKESLFSIDVKIIKAINNLFQDLKKVYETNNFLEKVIKKHWSIHLDELPDDFLPSISEYDNESYSQFRIIEYLKQISEYINTLGSHAGSITNQTGNIPWDLLKSIYLDLENNPLLKHNPRKLFEYISPNIYKLSQAFVGLTKILDEGYKNFCNLKKEQSLDISLTYKTLSDLNFISNNQSLIISSIKNIELIESLDFKDGEEKYVLIQCLQNIGEISKHFSKIIKEKLNSYGFNFKNLRDDIGHICEKIPNLTKFIKFLNDDKILQDIKNLTTNYKTLLIELKENLQALAKDPSLEINCILGLHEDSKEILGKRWIHKALRSVELEEDDKIFIGESYVNRQVEVMKFAIKKIQEIVDIVSVKNNNDYNKMRQELQSPKIHSECLFFLTMIGQSIQTIKTNDNFLSIVTFDLLKELDFLKWVRNSLMHLDKVNEKGTLIDYLANDLLTDFSITTHGQKIIEFSKYFDYVLNLLDEFQITVTHLGDSNYFQKYKGEDKKYLDFDINRKEVALEKVLEKNNKQKHTDFFSQKSNKSGFIIDKIIELKEEINQKSQELNIEIIGTFGKLAKFGYSIQGDNSGILVKVSENDILVSLAEFKQYIYDLFKYRIKIIEERQLIEYLTPTMVKKVAE